MTRKDRMVITLEIDVDCSEFDEAVDRAKTLKSMVRDPNVDNVEIASIRRR